MDSRVRTIRIEPADSTTMATELLAVTLRLQDGGTRWIGEVRLEGPEALERRVEGERCADVVAALGLITVLHFDHPDRTDPGPESARGEPSRSPQLESEEPPPLERLASATERTATAVTGVARNEETANANAIATAATGVAPDEETANANAMATAETGIASNEENAISAADGSTRFKGSRIAFVRLGYVSTPSDAVEAALGVELGSGTTGSSWSSAFALGYARGNDSSIVGTSTLTVLTAQFAVCPAGAAFDSGWWLRTCAVLRGGVLALGLSPGDRPIRTDDVFRPWLGVGPSLELGTPLSSAWTLRTLAGVGIQLVRDDFTLERAALDRGAAARVSIYQAELFSFGLSLGLAYGF